MQVIKQKYQEALPLLKKLHKRITNKGCNDSDTEKMNPNIEQQKSNIITKKQKKERVNFHRHYVEQKTVDEELLWMVPIILLFKAYC